MEDATALSMCDVVTKYVMEHAKLSTVDRCRFAMVSRAFAEQAAEFRSSDRYVADITVMFPHPSWPLKDGPLSMDWFCYGHHAVMRGEYATHLLALYKPRCVKEIALWGYDD